MANQLAGSTSPYLLQHAGNPVDWRPWGRGLRGGGPPGRPGLRLHRLRGLPLVPRHGARVLRGRGHRPGIERPASWRSRWTARSTRTWTMVHDRDPVAHRPGRLAHERVRHPGRTPLLRRDLLSARAPPAGRRPADAVLPPRSSTPCTRPGRAAGRVERAAAALAAGVGRQSNALAAVVLGAGDDGMAPDAGPQPLASAVSDAVEQLARLEDTGHGGSAPELQVPAQPRPGLPAAGGRHRAAALRASAWALASRTLAVMGTSSLADRSPAGSPATPPTGPGRCPTSRRCSTTTPSCCAGSPGGR